MPWIAQPHSHVGECCSSFIYFAFNEVIVHLDFINILKQQNLIVVVSKKVKNKNFLIPRRYVLTV